MSNTRSKLSSLTVQQVDALLGCVKNAQIKVEDAPFFANLMNILLDEFKRVQEKDKTNGVTMSN